MKERVPVAKEVMVLGDAPEARAAADQLLELGYSVSWVSPGDAPHSSGLCHPRLVSYGDCQLTALGGHVGRFRVQVSQDARVASFTASALVVAVGNDRYYPAERYGLAASSNVMGLSQVQMQCDEQRTGTSAEPDRRGNVLMMLDLGGETSKEMATEALHLALRLREECRSEVYLFYQNLKVDSSNYELLTRQMREKGVVFCRYASPKIDVGEGWVSVSYVEGTLRGELLVLPEAIRPHRDTQRLAGLLNVHLGEDGFFQDINIHHLRSGFSSRKGIFSPGVVIWTCRARSRRGCRSGGGQRGCFAGRRVPGTRGCDRARRIEQVHSLPHLHSHLPTRCCPTRRI